MGEIVWTPAHDLPAKAERKRIEKAEQLLAKVEEVLSAPVGDAED